MYLRILYLLVFSFSYSSISQVTFFEFEERVIPNKAESSHFIKVNDEYYFVLQPGSTGNSSIWVTTEDIQSATQVAANNSLFSGYNIYNDKMYFVKGAMFGEVISVIENGMTSTVYTGGFNEIEGFYIFNDMMYVREETDYMTYQTFGGVKEIDSNIYAPEFEKAVEVNDKLFFFANNNISNPTQVIEIDAFNNRIIKDSCDYRITSEVFVIDDRIIFVGKLPNGDIKLVAYDVLSSTFTELINNPFTSLGFHEYDNKLYFNTNNVILGEGLFQTDGTVAGTSLFLAKEDLRIQSPETHIYNHNDKMYMLEYCDYYSDYDGGCALWESDGTNVNTNIITDTNQYKLHSYTPKLSIADNFLFYYGNLKSIGGTSDTEVKDNVFAVDLGTGDMRLATQDSLPVFYSNGSDLRAMTSTGSSIITATEWNYNLGSDSCSLIKITPSYNVNIVDIENHVDVNIYTNNNQIYIDNKALEPCDYNVYSIDGKLHTTGYVDSESVEVDHSIYSNGIYIMSFLRENKVVKSIKFSVEN